ncbi:MAG TPA: hypothetical protein VFJ82_12400 [Longimicrobium sp.]|nr:hypothetical protein [Longimicrobium sp.]
MDDEALRAPGPSRAKVKYGKDLAACILGGVRAETGTATRSATQRDRGRLKFLQKHVDRHRLVLHAAKLLWICEMR